MLTILHTIIYSIIQEQMTPLHCAAEQGHTDCVALLKTDENVNMKDEVSLCIIMEYFPYKLYFLNLLLIVF